MILSCLTACNLIAQEEIGFPNGATRIWQLQNGNTVEATLRLRVRNAGEIDPSKRYSFELEMGGQRAHLAPYYTGSQGNQILSSDDLAWIRDAIFHESYKSTLHEYPQPDQIVEPDSQFQRNLLANLPDHTLRSTGTFEGAFARFVLWWDSEGYLPFSNARDQERKTQDFLRSFNRHFSTRRDRNWDFPSAENSLNRFLDREYQMSAFAAAKEVDYISPKRLAHYCQGRNATILGLSTFERGRRQYNWRIALVEANEAGMVRLDWHGSEVVGDLKPIDPNDGWVNRPGRSAWEIEIRNRGEIRLPSIEDNIRIVVDPERGNNLWVFRPYIVAEPELLSLAPPPILPPPINVDEPRARLADRLLSRIPGGTETEFLLRQEWSSPIARWANAIQPSLREWTSPAIGNGMMRGLTFEDACVVRIETQSGPVDIPFSELSPDDQSFVAFAAGDMNPSHIVDSGRFLYELRESSENALLLDIRFGDGFVEATWRDSDDPKAAGNESEDARASIVERARNLIGGNGESLRIDYKKLRYTGAGGFSGQLNPVKFSTEAMLDNREVQLPFTSSLLAEHRGLHCREIQFDRRSTQLGTQLFTRRAKIARLGNPEASYFWLILLRHPEFSSALQPFDRLFEHTARLGIVPVELIYQGTGNLDRAYRIQLLDFEVDALAETPAP